jgi:hypothetical protein
MKDLSTQMLWDELLAQDPESVAEKSGASLRLTDGGPVFTLELLGAPCELDGRSRTVVSPPGRPELDRNGRIVLLTYLTKSASGPAPGLADREVGPFALPSGQLFFRLHHELPHAPLARAFSDDPGALAMASEAVGARGHANLAWRARVLPFAEIYWYLDPADDEFPAAARYNYDANIAFYLPLDAVFALTCMLANTLISLKS